ncbi:undecaprenyl-phosphate galactose phosphotransferase WbaP [Deinococcus cellulosilyticus]|uniref:Undecaprenyl-phosphate galactose phosphotransferase WbaP n=1 Tax=Deinococcus cellulosilyticus (strain DSM 18568 / NBRC 106333 / KACC 11606 / 5516J-15) TaxID=1223518 RepID=A0A511MXF5_DEIC1|nr:undecaprenyl-phosphate galactose phosphotransferase WbaP [Deinococcus cellulosilyticus]GEM45259.1 undecaprenyl-phosphate galactose phosphotransferase WbaP [Deinococcus cellulosilyticus NBRC 106333 = KACC 11606]
MAQQTYAGNNVKPWVRRLYKVEALPQAVALVLADATAALLSLLLAYFVLTDRQFASLDNNFMVTWGAVWIFIRMLQGYYPAYGRSPQHEIQMHFTTTIQVLLIQLAAMFAVHNLVPTRLGLVVLWFGLFVFALPMRYLVRHLLVKSGYFGRPVVIIGAGKTGKAAIQQMLRFPAYGLKPVAIYDDNPQLTGQEIEGVPILGTLQDAVNAPLTNHALISIPGARAQRLSQIINNIHHAYPMTWVIPDFFGVPNQSLRPHSLGTFAALEVRNNLRSTRSRFIKRVLDILLVLLGGIVALPAMLIIALAIKLDSKGPAVYRARRIGVDGRMFDCLKFRSMYQDADQRLKDILASDPELRAEFEATHKLKDDPRVTRVGNFLRKTSLDELPQIWNVLIGDMSLVGPRPIVTAEIEKYGDIFEVYKQVRPGITGYWQVHGRSDTTYEERVNMDLFYVSNWSPWLDLVILIKTVDVVLRGKGAY